MSSQTFDVRGIGDSLDDFLSIAAESLMASDLASWQVYVDRVGRENLRGVFDASTLVGGMAFYRMGHWFGGKELAAAGLSGVAINPGYRGSGACAAMLRSVLRELRGEGIPLASLYASTQHLYRTVGFEHAGTQTQYSMPIESIRCRDRSLPAHRFVSPPLPALDFAADRRAALTNGNLRRSDGLWQRLLDPYDGRGSTTYLFGDVDAPEGFAILRPGTRDAGHPQPLVSTDVAANTPEALRRLLSLVQDHRSMCDTFEWFGPPNDPLHFLADEQRITVKHFMRWMLRIVDLPAAIEGRGYNDSVQGELHLNLTDSTLPENAGLWILSLSGGQAKLERGGDGCLELDVRSLAPLYSGFYSAEQLQRCGAIQSSNASQLQLATQIFAGPAPWVAELY